MTKHLVLAIGVTLANVSAHAQAPEALGEGFDRQKSGRD